MFEPVKKAVASAVAFGLVVMAGHAAQADTIEVGALPTDGSTLFFSGNIAPTPDHNHYDIYNFVLPFDVRTSHPRTPSYFHVETGNSGFIDWFELYYGFNASGDRIADNIQSYNTFGFCYFSGFHCSSIGAGADPLRRITSNDGRQHINIPAGNYSLLVLPVFRDNTRFTFPPTLSATGDYELRFTSAGGAEVPEPSTLTLALLATLGLSFYRRRRRRAA
jgi:hypothetical protein